MRREHSGSWWLVIALLAATGVACSSGGGGDDDGDGGGGGGDDDVAVLPVYEYQLTTDALDDPIVVQVPMGENLLLELGCPYGCPNLQGEYYVDSGRFTIEGGSHLLIRELNQPFQLFGLIQVDVVETFDVPFESLPTSGRMHVFEFTVAEPPDIGHVYLTVLPGGAGIQLEWDRNNDGTLEDEAVLSWAEFDELLGSEAAEWQQMGAFGYSVMVDFMLELAEYGLGGIELISMTSDVLPDVSPVTAPCDAFSDVGLSVPPPPPVFPDQGYETFAWYDDAASGDVNPGDSFGFDFDYCLVYIPEEDLTVLNGTIGLNSWTEVVSGGVLRRIGFEGTSPAGTPGGLVFEDFELWEVWDADDEGPGTVAQAHLGARINGRMTLVLFEPTN
jgi:hypothetical protein